MKAPLQSGAGTGLIAKRSVLEITFAVLALVIMADAFWRLVPGWGVGELPLTVTVVRAVVCSLGFVLIAAQWERALGLLMRSPLVVLLLGLVCISAIWAADPAMALQQGLLLLLTAALGVGLALRMPLVEFGLASGAAGVVLALCGLSGAAGLVTADPTAVALLVAGAAVLIFSAHTGLMAAGLIFLVCACGLSLFTQIIGGEVFGLICIVGAVAGFGLHALNTRGRLDPLTFVICSTVLIGMVSFFAMTNGFGVAPALASHFGVLGSNAALGLGFGARGTSIATSLGLGIGFWGSGLAVICLGWSLVAGLAGARGLVRRRIAGVTGSASAITAAFGLAAVIVAAPGSTPMIGAVTLAMFAMWSQSVTPTLSRLDAVPQLHFGRHADAIDLPPAAARQPVQRQSRVRPSLTRARVAAAMAEAELKARDKR
jgi:hypothetical protein